jgi:D-alanyl-D-alanine carboxypeptidase
VKRLVASAATMVAVIGAAAVIAAQAGVAARIDAIVEAPIKAGTVAGASVAVVRRGETIVDKGYGLADLELDVPTPRGATYEIGSVTKQFTAASILLLAEDGKLALDDELTKFLPDYPLQGHHVTIRRLLNHTSGIKSYTEMAEFGELMAVKKPKETLVTLFSGQPFDFPPGDEQIYNNSAFFLLGLIVEKASGKSYADFVRDRIFIPVGMKNSYYCSEQEIHKNHAHGYDTGKNGLVLKAYLDHSWPYAAGSLCSNTADLVAWNKALHGGKVLRPDSYKAMTSPGVLNDGTALRYGMGISLAPTDGRRTIAHSGGINGFLSESEYFPDDDLTIVVLLNTAGPVNPRDIARDIADAVLGHGPDRAQPFDGDLAMFAGVYGGRGRGRPARVRFAVSGNALTMVNATAANATPNTLTYYGHDTFGFKETVAVFERKEGRVSRLRLDQGGYGYNYLVPER